jgi:hypothetical protein
MDALHDACQTWCVGGRCAAVADVGAGEVERGGHCGPGLCFAAGMTGHRPDGRRRLAWEMFKVHAKYFEEARPTSFKALQFVVPVVFFGEQAVHHQHHTAVAGVAGDDDFGGDWRRVATPAVLLVAESRGRLPGGDLSRGGGITAVLVAEVESDCASDVFVNSRRCEP